MARVANHLMALCAAVGLSIAAGGSAQAELYKFYSGGAGYGGPFNGAGTVYAATSGLATLCPNGLGACGGDVISQPMTFLGGTLSASASGAAGGTSGVWDDLAPPFGGVGVSESATSGVGDDQITGGEVLSFIFGSAVTLDGVATLFDAGHTPFGNGDFNTSTFLLGVDGMVTAVTFLAANTIGGLAAAYPALNLTGTTFTFQQNGIDNLEFYVSGLSTVPLPGALPLFAGGLGLLGWMARRKRGRVAHA